MATDDKPLLPRSGRGRGGAARRYSEKEIAVKLRLMAELREKGLPMHEVARRLGVSDTTLYNWQIRAGMNASGLATSARRKHRLVALLRENERLARQRAAAAPQSPGKDRP
jgi:transposase-like protein